MRLLIFGIGTAISAYVIGGDWSLWFATNVGAAGYALILHIEPKE